MASHEQKDALPLPTFEKPTRVALIVAPFYRDIADNLIAGARKILDAANVAHETIEVPGALEIPTSVGARRPQR